MIPPLAGLRLRRNGQPHQYAHHHVLAPDDRRSALDIETVIRPAGGGMIPQPATMTGIYDFRFWIFDCPLIQNPKSQIQNSLVRFQRVVG